MARERKKPEGSFIERAKNEIENYELGRIRGRKEMNWIDYTKQKPTDKAALYLIRYGWHPETFVIEIAHWDGRTFYNEDWEACRRYEYKDRVRHWFKIEEPAANFADVGKIADHFREVTQKDLTWQDAKRIVEIADDAFCSRNWTRDDEEEYYTEVLRRFKEQ